MEDSQGTLYLEKREHKRIFKQFDVRYKLMPKEVSGTYAKLAGKSQDISAGGIKIEGEIVGEEGDIIRLELETGGGKEQIVIFAEIRWIRREKQGQGQFGLKFMALKDADIEVIKKIIAENDEKRFFA